MIVENTCERTTPASRLPDLTSESVELPLPPGVVDGDQRAVGYNWNAIERCCGIPAAAEPRSGALSSVIYRDRSR